MAQSSQASESAALTYSSELSLALERLDNWIEGQNFKGWDPHDALNSPIVRSLVGESHLLRLVAVQALRHSPVNMRPLLRVPKSHNPKAMGLFLTSYSHKYRNGGIADRGLLVKFFAQWLSQHAIRGYSGPCWGYNFDWPNRGFFAPAGTPTIVNTAFIGLAFLDAEPVLRSFLGGQENDGGGSAFEPLPIARGACDFVLRDLNRQDSSAGQVCFSYTPIDRRFVYNANLLGAQLLAAVHARTGETNLREFALSAARFAVSRQRSDGSWTYGISRDDQWVDNFHTGFVLVALSEIGRLLDTNEFESATRSGYRFWKERMFLENGAPKYYLNKTYPIDVHSVAQAILTFLQFSESEPEALKAARQISIWAINNLQDSSGFFHYQIHRWHRIRIPYMRWGQAWMQLALTKLQLKCDGHKRVPEVVHAR